MKYEIQFYPRSIKVAFSQKEENRFAHAWFLLICMIFVVPYVKFEAIALSCSWDILL